MNCVKISSRYDLPFNLIKFQPECLVSIVDVNAKIPEVVKNFNGPKLVMKFDDLLSDEEHGNTPNKEHIMKAISFAINNKGKSFLIHCTAGISRSSAMALLIEVISDFKDPKETLIKLMDKNPDIFPNDRIIKLATKITKIDFFTPFNELKRIMEIRFAQRLMRGDDE